MLSQREKWRNVQMSSEKHQNEGNGLYHSNNLFGHVTYLPFFTPPLHGYRVSCVAVTANFFQSLKTKPA